jgi:hypothetical protein
MRTTKRSSEGATLIAQTCTNVQGFSDIYCRLKRRMSTSGRSTGTLTNYARHLAQMALHYNCLPTELEDDQIEDYLYLLQQRHNTPFESYFKHTVYGLGFLFRLEGMSSICMRVFKLFSSILIYPKLKWLWMCFTLC